MESRNRRPLSSTSVELRGSSQPIRTSSGVGSGSPTVPSLLSWGLNTSNARRFSLERRSTLSVGDAPRICEQDTVSTINARTTPRQRSLRRGRGMLLTNWIGSGIS
jgi:hypothetical protein